MSYKTDLEHCIRESYKIISEYEEILRLSSDPKEQGRARRNVEEQWKLVKGHLDEYVPLCKRLNINISEDLVEIVVHFPEYETLVPQPNLSPQKTFQADVLTEINAKLDRLLTGQNRIFEAGLRERKVIVHILGMMEIRSEARLDEIHNLANRLQEWARRVEQTGLPADSELRQAIAQLAAPIDESVGINHYIEATLPLIPGILAYKFEFAAEHKVDLQALWDEIRKRFGLMS